MDTTPALPLWDSHGPVAPGTARHRKALRAANPLSKEQKRQNHEKASRAKCPTTRPRKHRAPNRRILSVVYLDGVEYSFHATKGARRTRVAPPGTPGYRPLEGPTHDF